MTFLKRIYNLLRANGVSRFIVKSFNYLMAEYYRLYMKISAPFSPGLIRKYKDKTINPDEVKHVLFIRLWGMGDMVLSIPALLMLKERFRDAEFTLVGSEGAARVTEGSGFFDHEFTVPLSGIESSSPDIYKAFDHARKLSPDLVFVAYPLLSWRVADIVNRLGAKWVFASSEDIQSENITKSVKISQDQNAVQAIASVAAAAGCKGPVPKIKLQISQEDRDIAHQWIIANAPQKVKISFHIGCTPKMTQKAWPLDRFADLAFRLHDNMDVSLILLEGPDEKEIVKQLTASSNVPFKIAGENLTLHQTMALIEKIDLLVTNDSFWMHAASALNTPLVALFGPAPQSFEPWGHSKYTRIIRSNRDCSPCWQPGTKLDCENPRCMESIDVDTVEKAVLDLLSINNRGTEI